MSILKQTIEIVKRFEGLKLKAYKDPVGIVTIGYGTTARAGVGIKPRMGMTITESEAEWYLAKAIEKFYTNIRHLITAPINDNELVAFLSLAYNIGPSAFKRSSALRHFNAGNKTKAANSILLWNKARGKVLNGLVKRREAEKLLFLTPQVTTTTITTPTPPAGSIWAAIAAFFALFGKAKL